MALIMGEAGKAFFFAKKKQKTSARAIADSMDKGFLVLFCKKGLRVLDESQDGIRRFLLVLLACLAAAAAQAGELDGVTLPETETVDGTSLTLNGLALRTYSFLKIRIYVAGLYLQHRSSDGEAVLASDEPKLLQFKFLRDVSPWAARLSWREGLDRNCQAPCHLPPEAENRFLSAIPGVHAGDTSTFVFSSKGLDVLMNHRPAGHIDDSLFIHVVLSTFIGRKPTAIDVKQGLLGVNG